jgi:two-component system response regulator YesN
VVIGTAANGLEGLSLIRSLCPDIVFTDIKMPQMDGIEMLEEANKNFTFKSVILTSFSEFDYAKKAISLDVTEYLLKPVDERKLREIVRRIESEIEEGKIYNEILEKTRDMGELKLDNVEIYTDFSDTSCVYTTEVLDQIRKNYAKKISLDTIAEELGVSNSYLSRKFKDDTGLTFHDMLNRFRLQKAIELLNKGIYRIYEVSDMSGFYDYKYFCSVFKKHIGVAPTEFLKTRRIIVTNMAESGGKND